MARTKGAVGKGVDNKDVRDYLLAHGPLSHQPHIVDHSLRGAKGQEKDSHRYSNERIFAMLRQLDYINTTGNDSNLLIVFYVQIMPDDFVMQLHRF